MSIRRWKWLWIDDKSIGLAQLIRLLNERLKALAEFLASGGGPGDGLYAAEGFLFNAGNVLLAGESEWLDIPSDFTITNAELVGDPAGTLSVAVYVSSYGAWDVWTLISAADPLTLASADKSQSLMTGWTRTFTGGHYLKFVITGTPTLVTKATATLTLTAPLSAGTAGASPSGPAGGVLSGTYPDPTFAVDMATQAELDAATVAQQAYTDARVAGLSWKQAVRVATTAAGTLASSFENGDTIDGVTLATGNRILIKNQAAPAENGIYTVNASGAPTRATDADSGAELVNATCYVSEGTVNADTQWTCSTNATITVGSTSLTFAQLSGGSGLTAQYSRWDPFVPESSPHADTDEFTSSSTISNWTGIYTGDASVVNDIATTQGRGMYFEAPSVLYRIRSRMKTIPVGDFTVHAAVILNAHSPAASTVIGCGIILADGTTPAAGKQTGVIVARNSGFAGSALSSGRLTWANYGNDATSAAYDTTDFAHSLSFIRLRRVTTTYYRAVSPDGENWVESTFTLLAGLTPTHYGLGFQNYGAVGTCSATVLFFRPYATGTQYKTGAMRTVYG